MTNLNYYAYIWVTRKSRIEFLQTMYSVEYLHIKWNGGSNLLENGSRHPNKVGISSSKNNGNHIMPGLQIMFLSAKIRKNQRNKITSQHIRWRSFQSYVLLLEKEQ